MLPRRIAQHTAAASHQNLSCQQQISSIAGMWAITSMIDPFNPFPFELSAAVVAMFHSMNQSRHDLKAGENSDFSQPSMSCYHLGRAPGQVGLHQAQQSYEMKLQELDGVGWYSHMLCTLCLCMIYIYIYMYTHYTLIHVYCAPYM